MPDYKLALHFILPCCTTGRINFRKDCLGNEFSKPGFRKKRETLLAGIRYYLPAYMKAVIEEPRAFDEARVRSSSWRVVYTFLPDEEDPELKKYFQERFSKIIGGKKSVCRVFLQYVANCIEYDEHAREIAKEALAHEFWSVDS